MEKKGIIILFLIIFLIAIATDITSAAECPETFKQNTDIELIQKCPSCSFVNITSITYPNGTVFLNEEMQKMGINFNFSLPDSSQEGKISYGTIGDKNNVSPPDFEELGIFITPSGNCIDTGESLMYILILVLLVILTSLGIYFSFIIPYENFWDYTSKGKVILAVTKTKYMKLIMIWVTSGVFLVFLTILTGMINNYVQFTEIKGLFTNIYVFLRILGYGLSVTIMWLLFLNFWKDILLNKEIIKHGKAFVKSNIR